MSGGAGKGDTPRPCSQKAWDEGYNRIDFTSIRLKKAADAGTAHIRRMLKWKGIGRVLLDFDHPPGGQSEVFDVASIPKEDLDKLTETCAEFNRTTLIRQSLLRCMVQPVDPDDGQVPPEFI